MHLEDEWAIRLTVLRNLTEEAQSAIRVAGRIVESSGSSGPDEE
jgi:tellurite resistance protein